VVHATQAFAQEATTAWESTVTLINDVEDWATFAKRELQERVSRVTFLA
jgi:hypothetical protein